MKNCFIIFLVIILAACGNPQDTVIPTTLAEWSSNHKKVVERLSEPDKSALMNYMLRVSMSEIFLDKDKGGFPAQIRIGDAINDQNQFAIDLQKREDEARSRQESKHKEDMEILKKLNEFIAVGIKGYSQRNLNILGIERELVITLNLQNRTDRDINGIKGRIEFIDMFDKRIGEFEFKYENGIKALTISTWDGIKSLNNFSSRDVDFEKLIDSGKFTTVFLPEAIVFSDGEKLMLKPRRSQDIFEFNEK
ncbi:MAG: hypothetical protein ACOYB1_01770 [Limnohabitans sp.]